MIKDPNSFDNSGFKSGFGKKLGIPVVVVPLPPAVWKVLGTKEITLLVLYGPGKPGEVP